MDPQPLEPPELVGERVRVRDLREDDVEPFAAAFRDDPDLGRIAGFDPEPDEDWVRGRVAEAREKAKEGAWLQRVIAAPDDRFLGDLVLHHIDWKTTKAEIGFWLVAAARGTGAAAEASRLLLRWTFAETPLHRIELRTLPENAATLALAERLGFTREGLLRDVAVERGRRTSLEQWSLLSTDPAARL